ncbi:MAG: zinc metallopeptidase [Firmicutes bacterium]|nr:zinc metallopeptidase [Bacillota bacterium]MBR5489500.1 zinc metallopeptidase [Bacillota bacterium]
MYYYDWSYMLLLPAIIFTMYAQFKVQGNFKKYSNVRAMRGLTGAQAARRMLDAAGLNDVAIEPIRGSLTDHYDPRAQVLRLSQTVYGVNSVAAVSVACHEAGHAIQHAEEYTPLLMRNNIVPLVNFASQLSWPLIVFGIILGASSGIGDMLFMIGVIAFLAVILFHAITLPVEFNASSRAMSHMESLGIIMDDEKRGARKVLSAAAMTYVASLAMAIMNLIRILALRNRD